MSFISEVLQVLFSTFVSATARIQKRNREEETQGREGSGSQQFKYKKEHSFLAKGLNSVSSRVLDKQGRHRTLRLPAVIRGVKRSLINVA